MSRRRRAPRARERPPRERAPQLDPLLQNAIASGVMSEAEARDLDAFADGIVARMRAGELTQKQADDLVSLTAIRDAQAKLRARARRGVH